jgi:hypothetical protein
MSRKNTPAWAQPHRIVVHEQTGPELTPEQAERASWASKSAMEKAVRTMLRKKTDPTPAEVEQSLASEKFRESLRKTQQAKAESTRPYILARTEDGQSVKIFGDDIQAVLTATAVWQQSNHR